MHRLWCSPYGEDGDLAGQGTGILGLDKEFSVIKIWMAIDRVDVIKEEALEEKEEDSKDPEASKLIVRNKAIQMKWPGVFYNYFTHKISSE